MSQPAGLDLLVRALVRGLTDPYARLKSLHDWLVLSTEYDEAALRDHSRLRAGQYATAALEAGIAVCAGYARAMVELCDIAKIPCKYVVGWAGDSRERHAWNLVRVHRKWYWLDVTWDDPTPDEPGFVSYAYFLVSTSTLYRTHRPDDDPCPVAPEDYIATRSTFNGRPVLTDARQVESVVRRAVAPGAAGEFIVWGVPIDAVSERVRRILRADSELARAVGGRWTTWHDRHYGLIVLRGEAGTPAERYVLFSRKLVLAHPSISSARVTIQASRHTKTFALTRELARRHLRDVTDGRGNPFYRYFPLDSNGLLRLEYDPTLGWQARVPASAPNGFLLNGETLTEQPVRLHLGDVLDLYSYRREESVPSCRLLVVTE